MNIYIKILLFCFLSAAVSILIFSFNRKKKKLNIEDDCIDCAKIDNTLLVDTDGDRLKYNILYNILGMYVVPNTGGTKIGYDISKKMKVIIKKANPDQLSYEEIKTNDYVPLGKDIVIISAPRGETVMNIGYSPACGWYGCQILEYDDGVLQFGNSNKLNAQTVRLKRGKKSHYVISKDLNKTQIQFCKETNICSVSDKNIN